MAETASMAERGKKGIPGRPRNGNEKLGQAKLRKLLDAGIQSPSAIAEISGCAPATASQAISRYIKDVKALEDYKKNRADILAEKQREVLAALCPADIKKASGKDKAMIYGIFYDKERLERGESTSNLAGIVKVLRAADSEPKTHKSSVFDAPMSDNVVDK